MLARRLVQLRLSRLSEQRVAQPLSVIRDINYAECTREPVFVERYSGAGGNELSVKNSELLKPSQAGHLRRCLYRCAWDPLLTRPISAIV